MIMQHYLLGTLFWCIHMGLVVVMAPACVGIVAFFEDIFTGVAPRPVLSHWRELYFTFRSGTSSASAMGEEISGWACTGGLVAALSAAALVPAFTSGMLFCALSDLLFIVCLMGTARLMICMAGFARGAPRAGKLSQGLAISGTLAEPAAFMAMVVTGMIVRNSCLDDFIARAHMHPAAEASAPCILLALALFLAWWNIYGPSGRALYKGVLADISGAERAVALMASDVIMLVWLSLVALFLWPQSIATPAGNSVSQWVVLALLGLGWWCLKLFLLCVVLALARVVYVPHSARQWQVHSGLAVLLGFLALAVVFVGRDFG